MKPLHFVLPTLLASALVALPALANDADKAACAALDDGDDCTRGDGRAGLCTPDASDPDVLTCDDDASADDSSGDDSGGCSSTGTTPASTGAGALLLGLGLVALHRRRDRRD